MRNSVVYSLVFIMMMPLLSGALSSPLIAPAQAADACQGDTQAIEWNQTMQRMAMVPYYANNYDPYYYDTITKMVKDRPARQTKTSAPLVQRNLGCINKIHGIFRLLTHLRPAITRRC